MATVVSGGDRVLEVQPEVATDKELVLAFQGGTLWAFAGFGGLTAEGAE